MAKHSKKSSKKSGKKHGKGQSKRRARRNGMDGIGAFVAASLGAVAFGTALSVGLSYTSLSDNMQDLALAVLGLAGGITAEVLGSPRLAVGLWAAPTAVAAVRATVRMGQAGAVQRAVDAVRAAMPGAITGGLQSGAAPAPAPAQTQNSAQVPAPAGLPMGYSPYTSPAGAAFFGAYSPQSQMVSVG